MTALTEVYVLIVNLCSDMQNSPRCENQTENGSDYGCMFQDHQAAYLDFLFLLLEELFHLFSSLLLIKDCLSHNLQLLFQCNIVGPGLLQPTEHTHIYIWMQLVYDNIATISQRI